MKIPNPLASPANKRDEFQDFDNMRTQKNIDVSIIKILPSWKGMKGEFAWTLNDESSVTKSDALERLKANLAFSKDFESISLCNANYYVIHAVL
jgi:hypothetical protein